MSGVSTPFKSGKKKKEAPPTNLLALVKKKDRLKAAHVIDYLEQLVECAQRVADPLDDIERIFTKIQKWKQSFGDLDQQEKAVAAYLKNRGDN